MVKVKFFAQVREIAGVSEVQASVPPSPTVDALREQLMQMSSAFRQALEGQVLTAVNQTLCSGHTPIADGDEVAFFPPVTGG